MATERGIFIFEAATVEEVKELLKDDSAIQSDRRRMKFTLVYNIVSCLKNYQMMSGLSDIKYPSHDSDVTV